MRYRYSIMAILFSCIFLSSISACAGKSSKLEVRWKDALFIPYIKDRPSNVADFSRLLGLQWKDENGNSFTYKVEYKNDGKHEQKTLRNCNDLVEIFPYITQIKSEDVSISNLYGWFSTCEAIKKMPLMADSITTHISFDVKSILSDLAKIEIHSSDESKVSYFDGLNNYSEAVCRNENDCEIKTDEKYMAISIVALGDYNHDGIEDAVILANSQVMFGGGYQSIGLVVTRKGANSGLIVLDSW